MLILVLNVIKRFLVCSLTLGKIYRLEKTPRVGHIDLYANKNFTITNDIIFIRTFNIIIELSLIEQTLKIKIISKWKTELVNDDSTTLNLSMFKMYI